MVLLKKTLQVEERYPYPVRLEAMYEVIDQSPMRKLEKLRQKGFVQKCREAGVEGQVEEGTLTGERGMIENDHRRGCLLKGLVHTNDNKNKRILSLVESSHAILVYFDHILRSIFVRLLLSGYECVFICGSHSNKKKDISLQK